MRQLLHGDILLPDFTVLKNGYIGIDGSTIEYIGASEPDSFGQAKKLPNCILMPGLYNMHTHTSMVLLRGLGSDLPLDRWLHEAMFPIEAKMTEPDISVGTRLAMMEMLACGTVSFTDMYDHPRVSVKEIGEAGIKANIGRPVLSFDANEKYEDNWRAQDSLAFFSENNGLFDGRLKVDFSIHAEYTSHSEMVRRYGQDCKERGAIMHLHLSETEKEHVECIERNGVTPAKYFYDLGVLDSPTVAAHCVMVTSSDIELLAEKGVTPVHNPSSNLKLGSGFMPMAKMLEKGLNIALGTDGAASNNNLNIFEEMHIASIIHKGITNDPTLLKPAQLLAIATANGAKAQGRGDCGSLKVGNKADIVAVSLDSPHMMPIHDYEALLVYSAQGSDVVMTMVDGNVLYENGEYKTIDVDRVKYDLKKSIDRLI